MKLAEFSVKRPITILMITVSIVVLGFLSLQRLPLTLLPEFSSQSLNVSVNYPSSSPEEVERQITRPLEEMLSTLNYLERITSSSSGSGANIRLEFKAGTDMDLISLEVRDRIDQARNRMPLDVERITLRRFQTSDIPVFRFSIAWEGDRSELYNIIEDIVRPRLERLDGVANVEVRGIDNKQIIIDLDQNLLQTYGIDIFNLSQTLRANNISVSGGFVIDGERKYTLRTVGEFTHPEELSLLPVGNGRLTLGDLGTVRYDFPEKNTFSRLNQQEAVTVSLYKASTANVVSVCELIRQEIESIVSSPQFEERLAFQVFSDQSRDILRSLNDLKTAGIFGGVLAMAVLFLFLMKFRSTLIISLAIPVSVVFTFAFMYLLRVFAGSDITLNVISLMGLIVSIGMLVDASVVVLENIFRHKQEGGLSAYDAAIKGSHEVGVAVLASTATTVIVFVSFIFGPSAMTGRFMRDFGVAASIAIVASLVVALTLIPMLSSRIFTGKERPKQKALVGMTNLYGAWMKWFLRWRVLAIVLLVLVVHGSCKMLNSIDREMMPNTPQRQLRIDVRVERSFSLDQMLGLFQMLEDRLLSQKDELQIDSIASNFNNRSTSRGQFRGDLDIYLIDEGPVRPVAEIQEKIRELMPTVPGAEIRFGRMRGFGGGSETGVEVRLTGDDARVLAQYADIVKTRLIELPGIRDVQTTLETGEDEIHLLVDRRRSEMFGVSPQDVARTVSAALSTRAASRMKTEEGELDIVVQLSGIDQFSVQQLQNLRFENRNSEMISLYTVADFSYQKGPLAIQREDRKSVLNVVANLDRGSPSMMTQTMISAALDDLALPAGYRWDMGRQWRQFQQQEAESYFAIYLALIMMYIVMAALFESFIHPLTILLCVPFSLLGVAILFYLTGTSLSPTANLGLLILFGIVVNNGIILINHINILRRQGMQREEAIIKGGKDRLRPILMTAATSLIGLLPLTLPTMFPDYFTAVEGRARMWSPVSLAVFGGLTTSTFLTLVILPSVYALVDDFARFVARSTAWILSFVRRFPELVSLRG